MGGEAHQEADQVDCDRPRLASQQLPHRCRVHRVQGMNYHPQGGAVNSTKVAFMLLNQQPQV